VLLSVVCSVGSDSAAAAHAPFSERPLRYAHHVYFKQPNAHAAPPGPAPRLRLYAKAVRLACGSAMCPTSTHTARPVERCPSPASPPSNHSERPRRGGTPSYEHDVGGASVHPEEKVASPIYFWQAFRCRAVKLPLRSQRPCSPSDSVYSLSEVQTACHRPYTFLIWKERPPHSPCTTLTPQTRPNFLKWSPEYRVASPIYL
jgi:hypothetical protein